MQSVILLALGYRDKKQIFLANAKKARKSTQQLFVEIN